MITITVVSYNNEAPLELVTAQFGPAGGTIGRSNDNLMVLNDPKRYVSRVQAMVKSDGREHFILNLSKANPILINGSEIALDQPHSLAIGDDIQIGLYHLRAESPIEDGHTVIVPNLRPMTAPVPAAANPRPQAPAPMPQHMGQVSQSPVGGAGGAGAALPMDLFGSGHAAGDPNDPFGDLMGTPPAPPAMSAAPMPPAMNMQPRQTPAIPAADPAAAFDDLLGISPSSPPLMPPKPPAQAQAADHHYGFDDLLGDKALATPGPRRDAPLIPDHFDPFAMPSQQNAQDPLDSMWGNDVSLDSISPRDASIDSLISSADASATRSSILDPNSLAHRHSSETDPMAMFSSESLLHNKQDESFAGMVAPDHGSDLNAHFIAPQLHMEPGLQRPAPLGQQAIPNADPLAMFDSAPPAPNGQNRVSGMGTAVSDYDPFMATQVGMATTPRNAVPQPATPIPQHPPHQHIPDADPLAMFGSDPLLSGGQNQAFAGLDISGQGSGHSPVIPPQAHLEQAPRNMAPPAMPRQPIPDADPLAMFGSAPSGQNQPFPGMRTAGQDADPFAPTQAPRTTGNVAAQERRHTPPVPGTPPLPPPHVAAVGPARAQTATPGPGQSQGLGQAQGQGQQLDGMALAQAFLRGANLPLDTIPSGVTLEWMEMIGEFVATATHGAVELIASRALVKREVKADLTMIVARRNNPLKFLPDGQSALIQMLGKKIPGFMEPTEAMNDAYLDLRAHQIGMFAGMRAALDEILKRFDPVMLEKKLKPPTLMDSFVESSRKVKMWDAYSELFKTIYNESQEDFQKLFGKAFLTAYENEIKHFLGGAQQ